MYSQVGEYFRKRSNKVVAFSVGKLKMVYLQYTSVSAMKANLTLSTLSRLQRQQDNTFPFNFCYYSSMIHGTINAADCKLLKLFSLPKVKPKTFPEGSHISSIHKKVTKDSVASKPWDLSTGSMLQINNKIHIISEDARSKLCALTWSLCSATSSAEPLLGVGMTFASIAFSGSGSCRRQKRQVTNSHTTVTLIFGIVVCLMNFVPLK